MVIAVDYDGTLVEQDDYSDTTTTPQVLPGALKGLTALKAAGHTLILVSDRANQALRADPALDPLVTGGRRKADRQAWAACRPLYEARFQQMVAHAAAAFPGVFDAIDDGKQGPVRADLFISGKAVRIGAYGMPWSAVATMWGAQTSK